jgi:hypothetical protein
MSPPLSGSKNKPRKKLEWSRWLCLHLPPKRRLTFNGLYGVITQKIELFITTAVRSLWFHITLLYLGVIYTSIYLFWNITPCNPLKVNRRFGGTCLLHLFGRQISQARNQNEAGGSACTCLRNVFDFQQTARHYIPEDRNFHNNHRCEAPKSYLFLY